MGEMVQVRTVRLFLFEAVVLEAKRPAVLCDRADNVVWCASGYFRMDLEVHLDGCVHQPGDVLNNFLSDLPGIACDASGVQINGAVKPCGFSRAGRGRPGACRCGRTAAGS